MALDYYDPFTISQIASRAGQMMEAGTIPSKSGMTRIYHGTPYLDEISKMGGFDPNKKSYWSPDRSTAEQYAKRGWGRGTPWGPVTGDVLEGQISSEQAQRLAKRGFTGGKEIVLSGKESTDLYRRGIANVKGSPSWTTQAARWFPKAMRAAGEFVAKPLALSDILLGTNFMYDRDPSNISRESRSEPYSDVNQYAAGRGAQPTFERPSANRDFTRTDYGKSYQAGGSVNPFEETARAGRDYKRDNLPPYRATPSDNVPDYFARPYEPDLDRNIPDAYPLGDDEGIFNIMRRKIQDNPILQKSRSVYDWLDQNRLIKGISEFDIKDEQIGWEYNPELWGGNLDIKFGLKKGAPYGFFGYTREI